MFSSKSEEKSADISKNETRLVDQTSFRQKSKFIAFEEGFNHSYNKLFKSACMCVDACMPACLCVYAGVLVRVFVRA